MKKPDLGQTIGVLANVGVVAGIIFLGFELQQNNELMASEARRGQLSIQMEGWGAVVGNPDIIPLFLKDRNGERLSVEETLRLDAFWMRNLVSSQWQYYEREQLVSDQFVIHQRKNFEAYPSLRKVWEGNSGGSTSAGKDTLDLDFVEFMEQNVINVNE